MGLQHSEEKVDGAMDVIREQVRAGLGDQCDRFDPGCMTCQAWRALEDMGEILYQVWKAEQS